MSIAVKICGLTKPELVEAAVDSGASYVGFVFYPKSPRNVVPVQAGALAKVAGGAKTVAIVVDPDDQLLDEISTHLAPDYFQLHGHETVGRIKEIRRSHSAKLIKAFSVRGDDDIAQALPYEPHVDMLLFDARAPQAGLPGGNGVSFDWFLLQNRQFQLPWMLSGGISTSNVSEAVRISGAKLVDVSSSVEKEPGLKDPGLMAEFMQTVKAIS